MCKHYINWKPSEWTSPACFRRRPANDLEHALFDGCRRSVGEIEVARRLEKELGERAKAGPCRDPAIFAAGRADLRPIIDDDLGLDADVRFEVGARTPAEEEEDRATIEEETPGIRKNLGRVVTKEEEEHDNAVPPASQTSQEELHIIDPTEDLQDNDGFQLI